MRWRTWEITARIERRDKWVGVFGPDDRGQRSADPSRSGYHPDDHGRARHVYVCPVPCLVIHAWRWLRAPACDAPGYGEGHLRESRSRAP
jgi:hypothetical protein